MQRPIKFRGKRIDNGEWVYGSLNLFDCKQGTESQIVLLDGTFYKVIPSTIGQYTELCDSEANDVYENDFINARYGIGKIVFREGCFFIEWVDDPEANVEPIGWTKNNRPRTGYIIIGNLHDNPELIK